MAVYSVYNYGSKSYDYYDDGQPAPTHAGPPPIAPMGGIGETPESAAWRLPLGARKVGSGDLPRGKIASLGGTDTAGDLGKLAVIAGVGYLIWKHWRKPR